MMPWKSPIMYIKPVLAYLLLGLSSLFEKFPDSGNALASSPDPSCPSGPAPAADKEEEGGVPAEESGTGLMEQPGGNSIC